MNRGENAPQNDKRRAWATRDEAPGGRGTLEAPSRLFQFPIPGPNGTD